MPEREKHLKIDRLLFGKEFPEVHRLLDFGVQQLGPHHRKVTHNQETVGLIFLMSGGDLGALVSAEVHILADREFSRSQKILREMLGSGKANKRRRR